MNQIGLVVGGGTGRELSEVFRAATDAFGALGEQPVAITECPSELGSFTELHGLPPADCARIVQRDLVELGRFYREFYCAGGRAIFRTAVNAETLYALRRQLQAVKVSHVTLGRCRVSFIRDQHQGFYTCDSWDHADGAIRFQGSFRKADLQRIHDYALAESSAWLGPDHDTWFVYKHHLFGNTFVCWASEISPRAAVLQPGMAYAKLASRIESGGRPLLLIAGNEIGDLLQEVFLAGTGLSRDHLFAQCLSASGCGGARGISDGARLGRRYRRAAARESGGYAARGRRSFRGAPGTSGHGRRHGRSRRRGIRQRAAAATGGHHPANRRNRREDCGKRGSHARRRRFGRSYRAVVFKIG
jgi:hypothetical protein